jgi:hypothetical protein
VACVDFQVGLSNQDPLENAFNLFPNPAENVIYIEYTVTVFSITIYNQLGQVVLIKSRQELSTELNVNDFSRGVYYVELVSENKTFRKKFVLK